MQMSEAGVFHLVLKESVKDEEAKELGQADNVDALGWSLDFFDRTYGALASDPIERASQLPLEVRAPLD